MFESGINSAFKLKAVNYRGVRTSCPQDSVLEFVPSSANFPCSAAMTFQPEQPSPDRNRKGVSLTNHHDSDE
jgi:hypothetical protein